MQHEYHQVPVTALVRCCEDLILAGEGHHLCCYDRASGNLRTRLPVFSDQAIHGIALSENNPIDGVVWGGATVRRIWIEISHGEPLVLKLGPLFTAHDWILNAAISPSSLAVGIVTAHNALWLLHDFEESKTQAARLDRIVAGSNCILYSAHIKWLSSSHCLVASGTAFGDTILWSAILKVENGKTVGQSQTHYTFSAHNGSIFGVQISSVSRLPGALTEVRVLATCSDDRNIKLWDVSDLTRQSPTLTEIQGDTGFGSRGDHAGLAPPCLAKIMGHVSRIWHLHFTSTKVENELNTIMSFGEDATAITWKIYSSLPIADLPYKLTRERITAAHSGKNIWSTATTTSGAAATGGSDGAIIHHNKPTHSCTEYDVSLNFLNTVTTGDHIKTYCFMVPDILFASTEQGQLVIIDLSTGDAPIATTISSELIGLKSYSVLQSVPGFGFAAGSDGNVYSYHHESRRLSQLASVGKKIANLFPCSINEQELALLVTSVGSTSAELIYIGDGSPEPRATITLALPDGFLVTSFTCCSDSGSNYALLGSRKGSLQLFALDPDSSLDIPTLHPRATVDVGKEAITSLHYVPLSNRQEHAGHVFSTARDSSLAIHEILTTPDAELTLHLVHQLSLPFGPNIEGLHLDPLHDRCWTWGFRSKDFIVYDVVAQQEIMVVECGGAHRNWAFQPGEGDGTGTFVWTKAGKVSYKKQGELPWEVMKDGGHGREIKAVAVPTGMPSTISQLVATGAEDTDIKISRIVRDDNDQTRLHCLQTLRKHNTGIQHLQWSRNGRTLFSSGGFEEFFVWQIEHDVPFVDVGVVCVSKHPRSGTSDLRIMGFHAEESKEGREGFKIVMAYSDSSVKIWRYDVRGGWECMQRAEYLTACLTAVIPVPDHDNGMAGFLTTATDGHIVQWDAESTASGASLRWSHRRRVHQNAILAYATLVLPNESVLLATGGDDDAIALTLYTASTAKLGTSLRVPRAHAAAITGLAFVSTRGNDRVRLLSVGLDQRIKMWEMRGNVGAPELDGLRFKLVEDNFTAVADASGLETWGREEGEGEERVMMVCGVGLDVWRVHGE